MGIWMKRRRAISETLRLRPDFAEAHNNLGNVLALQGKPTKPRRVISERCN